MALTTRAELPDRFGFGELERWLVARGRHGIDGRLPPLDSTDLAVQLGVGRTMIRWYRTHGLTPRRADELAVELGVHPCAIWPQWFPADAAPIVDTLVAATR